MRLIALFTVVVFAAVSHAQPNVYPQGNGNGLADPDIQQVGSGTCAQGLTTWNITLTANSTWGGGGGFLIQANSTCVAIQNITVINESSHSLTLEIYNGSPSSPAHLGSIGSINASGSTGPVTLYSLYATELTGAVTVHRIESMYVKNSIAGDITVLSRSDSTSPSANYIVAGTTTTAGSITGDIHVDYSTIGEIKVIGGNIGSSSTPITITCGSQIASGSQIGHIYANSVFANIHKPSGTTDQPTLGRLEAVNGSIGGTIHIKNPVYVPGFGDMGIFVTGSGAAFAGTLIIDTAYPSSVSGHTENFILPANGLTGQVIINAGNATSSAWAGDIGVDGIILGPGRSGTHQSPYYQLASGALGDGSVGVAPFQLNHYDCAPSSPCMEAPCWAAADARPIVSQSTIAGDGIKLRFYGPIEIDLNASVPVNLYKTDASDPWGYPDTLIDPSNLDFSTESNSGITRTLVVKKHSGATLAAGRYTLMYLSGGIKCDQVYQNPDVGWFSYNFILDSDSHNLDQQCGSADFNCDDEQTDLDIEAFWACIAGQCPASPCTSTADFNFDGEATDLDIEAFYRVLAGGHC